MDVQQRIAVKALLVDSKGRVLLLRKSHDDVRHAGKSGRYNSPGGKVNPGELLSDALVREVGEEVGLAVDNLDQRPIFAGEWRPTVNNVVLQIIGIFYVCREWHGDVLLDNEHDDHQWASATTFASYDILPPEDAAIRSYYKEL